MLRFVLLLFSIAFVFLAWPRIAEAVTCTNAQCHGDIKAHRYLHRPLKADGCVICHEVNRTGAHDTSGIAAAGLATTPAHHPTLIKLKPEQVNERCLVCHDSMKGNAGHKFAHSAIAQKSCIACHNPHGSEQAKLLKMATVSELCLSCHTQKQQNLKFKHSKALTQDKACLNCHEVHFGDHEKMLKSSVGELCLNCHKDKKAKPEFLSQHQPVKEGKCQQCHDPHGNASSKFMTLGDLTTPEKICWSCHKTSLMQTELTADATGFRNGTENLHCFHLHGKFKNRNCFTCHEAHFATQDHLIRNHMTFVGQLLPVQFNKTPNGGTCTTACHGLKQYDRNAAVANAPGR